MNTATCQRLCLTCWASFGLSGQVKMSLVINDVHCLLLGDAIFHFKSSGQVSYTVTVEKSNLDLSLTTWASETWGLNQVVEPVFTISG